MEKNLLILLGVIAVVIILVVVIIVYRKKSNDEVTTQTQFSTAFKASNVRSVDVSLNQPHTTIITTSNAVSVPLVKNAFVTNILSILYSNGGLKQGSNTGLTYDATQNKLIVDDAGDYLIDLNINYKTTRSVLISDIQFRVNGNPVFAYGDAVGFSWNGKWIGHSYIRLNQGDQIDLALKSTKNGKTNIEIRQGSSLGITKLDESSSSSTCPCPDPANSSIGERTSNVQELMLILPGENGGPDIYKKFIIYKDSNNNPVGFETISNLVVSSTGLPPEKIEDFKDYNLNVVQDGQNYNFILTNPINFKKLQLSLDIDENTSIRSIAASLYNYNNLYSLFNFSFDFI